MYVPGISIYEKNIYGLAWEAINSIGSDGNRPAKLHLRVSSVKSVAGGPLSYLLMSIKVRGRDREMTQLMRLTQATVSGQKLSLSRGTGEATVTVTHCAGNELFSNIRSLRERNDKVKSHTNKYKANSLTRRGDFCLLTGELLGYRSYWRFLLSPHCIQPRRND